MTPLNQLPPCGSDPDIVQAVIDTPMGSRAKYKYDEKERLFRLSKLLPLGAHFPYNFGFIPSTSAEDGDALDVLILMDEPAALGTVAPVKLVGVLKGEQTEKGKTVRNDRLLAVLSTQYNPPEIDSIEEIDKHRLEEIEYFFISYNKMHKRKYKPIGRGNAREAEILLKKGKKNYDDSLKAA